jgi:dTDP-4-dehydrorhamnose 3,5-epimerase
MIEPERFEDGRGFFARTWCREEFAAQGLNADLVQCNISFNIQRGTLRGMHYQKPPHAEAKLVRCTQGALYDVVVDLRRDSATYLQWFGTALSAENRNALYVPEGCAHGFVTLEDHTEVLYQMSASYDTASAAGVRWDDPAFSIAWPIAPTVMSDRDRNYPDFQP